jgi:hypothetical protein
MMTEWGGTCVDPTQRAECVFVADLADAHLQSYTEWDGCFPNNANFCTDEYISLFSRTFARATAGLCLVGPHVCSVVYLPHKQMLGVVANMTYHDSSKAFELCYTPTTSVLPTEIYANFALHYSTRPPRVRVPSGYTYRFLGFLWTNCCFKCINQKWFTLFCVVCEGTQ